MPGKIKSNVSRKQYRSSESIVRRRLAERNRERSIVEGFEQLRNVIPFGEIDGKKKTKNETLLGAIQHIRNLENILKSNQIISETVFQNYEEFPEIDICNSPNSTISQVSDFAQFAKFSALWDYSQPNFLQINIS